MPIKKHFPLIFSGGALALISTACAQKDAVRPADVNPAAIPPVTLAALRAPAVPLVAHDPYFSVWSTADKLTDTPTKHWTGKEQSLTSLLRIDGKTYRLMGDTPADFPALAQTGVEILPTRTIYSFAGAGVRVRMTWTSPLLPEDLALMSRPVTYLSWDVVATDGKSHEAALYLDASGALAVNQDTQKVVWSRPKNSALTTLQIGTQAQPVLAKTGDDLRIDWGHFLLAAPQKDARGSLSDRKSAQNLFAARATLPADVAPGARAVNAGAPVASLAFGLGKVGDKSTVRHALLAYDDEYSIQFMGRNLRPYWRRDGATQSTLLQSAESDYASVQARCISFDAELMADLTSIGGVKYATLAALAYRQALAAQKIVADENGQPLSFSKENNSNGCIATVDVFYPASPQMLALSPSLMRATLQPILLYSASNRWKWPFAPHDLGTYPKANGQVYGGGERTEENQMPVEESGNMLLMIGALSKLEGNTKFADPFWPVITKWANYLAEKGFDPESQLSTDDFAGHLAHNVNLSAKAIVALGAYAQMAEMRGETTTATKYRDLAQTYATQWVKESEDGDHSRLAFDKTGTWSQKYNLVWDKVLGINLFPASVYERETAFYKTKLNKFGLPLDSRRDYTKLDWTVWTATMAPNRQDFEAIVAPAFEYVSATSDRVPLSDWYDTKTARRSGFMARSVVGGVFMPLLGDANLWQKWTARDKNRPANWAALPVPPTVREVILTGENTPGIKWQYTTKNPGANWYSPTFNASTWATGEAGFGSNGTPGVNIRTPWNTPDIYLRRTFTSDGKAISGAQIYGFHDEDAEIYINGKNVGTIEGFNARYEPIFPLPAGVLKAGKNVMAVHVHQSGGGQGVDLGIAEVK